MTWWDWLVVAAVWALIPLAIWAKRRQDRQHAQHEAELQREIAAIKGGGFRVGYCPACRQWRPGMIGHPCHLCQTTLIRFDGESRRG